MKNLLGRFALFAVLTGLPIFGGAIAAEERDPLAERLEPRLNQMAQHQEQFMRQMTSQMERLEQRLNQMVQQEEQRVRRMDGQMERQRAEMQARQEGMHPPLPPPPGARPSVLPDGGAPAAKHLKAIGNILGLGLLLFAVCNILMAIWIFTDIRKRGEGPAIFVAMALIAGIPAALIYSLVRMSEKKTSSS